MSEKTPALTRVLVAADLHLGAPQGRIGGWDNERQSYRSWIESGDRVKDLVSYANQNDVDLILLAGDIFDSGNPHPEVVADFLGALNQLSPDIQVIAIEGNHDQRFIVNQHRTPLDAYLSSQANVVEVVKDPGIIEAKGLRVACLPWIRVGGSGEVEDKQAHAEQEVLRLAEEGADIFIGHLTLSDIDLFRGSESSMTTNVLEVALPSSLLASGPWEAALLGHVHSRQFFGDKVNYVGSTHRVSFKEEKDDKGFDILDFDANGKLVDREFVRLDGISYFTVEFGNALSERRAKRNVSSGDMVRIQVHGVDVDEAASLLSEFRDLGANTSLVIIQDEADLVTSTREGMEITTTPFDAIKDYGERSGLGEATLKRVLKTFSDLVTE